MTQSEEILEQGLIKTLTEMSYEYVSIKEEENLLANIFLNCQIIRMRNDHENRPLITFFLQFFTNFAAVSRDATM